MFSHVVIGTDDPASALMFYDRTMALLGWSRAATDELTGAVGYAPGSAKAPMLFVGRPYDGGAAAPGNGGTVALLAPDAATVRHWHATALAAGGHDEGSPGPRPHYHPGYYAAYARDPAGNKLCCVCHFHPSEPR